eukprot:3167890-Rhodomonas_salina.1
MSGSITRYSTQGVRGATRHSTLRMQCDALRRGSDTLLNVEDATRCSASKEQCNARRQRSDATLCVEDAT